MILTLSHQHHQRQYMRNHNLGGQKIHPSYWWSVTAKQVMPALPLILHRQNHFHILQELLPSHKGSKPCDCNCSANPGKAIYLFTWY